MRNRVLSLAAVMFVPFAVFAQEITVSPQEISGPSNVLSIQPINAVLLTAWSAEYERKVGGAVTVGVGGTHWDVGEEDDLTYASADLKLRYYPQGNALQGFAFGGTVGFSSISATSSDGTDESASGPSFGILIEYQWLMGVKRNFALALGVGAKSVMVDEDAISSDDFILRYPTARLSVGFAF